MYRNSIIVAVAALIIFTSCKPRPQKDEAVIGKPEIKVENGKLSPEVLWAFGRIGDVSVSPDGKKILYSVTYYSVEENKGNAELYTMNIDGSDVKRLTTTKSSEWNAVWNPRGDKIGFIYADSNGANIFEMNPDGSNRTKISNFDVAKREFDNSPTKELAIRLNEVKVGDLEAFSYSPDGKKILYVMALPKYDKYSTLKKGLDKTTGRINDDLAYRHWDGWVDNIPQPFIADFDGKHLGEGINLLSGTEYESPMRPWGGIEQFAWSPDSKTIAYTCRKKTGKDYAFSTNSDIFLYNLDTKQTKNISEGMMGYDQNPVFSPDGKYLAWESMERDGYEADKIRLMLCNLTTTKVMDCTKDFDQNANDLKFSKDSKSIYFISDFHGRDNIYRLSIGEEPLYIDVPDSELKLKKGKDAGLAITAVTNTIQDYTAISYVSDNTLIATQMSMSHPAEIWKINAADGKQTKISSVNDDLMAEVKWGRVEERWQKTTDGKQMQTWIIYPPDFDSTKKYPTLLYCEGGPQSTVSQFWSYRWNFQIMAANGYIIVAPNRRGLPGFGTQWNEQISGDYGGQCMKDYLTAIDEMCKEPFVDKDRLGSVGASFGGFSVYWLAGHHNKRFKCFIAHNGMFNLEQQYLETEEMWFEEWDLGGAYWINNPKTKHSYANSPHKFVDKWDTPLLVIHSENDYRIVASQGMSAYNAAVIRGIPARYLYFPDESHWVLKPQNGVLWQRNFFDWLDMWLKK